MAIDIQRTIETAAPWKLMAASFAAGMLCTVVLLGLTAGNLSLVLGH